MYPDLFVCFCRSLSSARSSWWIFILDQDSNELQNDCQTRQGDTLNAPVAVAERIERFPVVLQVHSTHTHTQRDDEDSLLRVVGYRQESNQKQELGTEGSGADYMLWEPPRLWSED